MVTVSNGLFSNTLPITTNRFSVNCPFNWKAMFFTASAGIGSTALITFTPLISFAPSISLFLTAASFSFMNSSICFFKPAFSSMYLEIAAFRSGALLNNAFKSLMVSCTVSNISSTFAPVTASIRRTPAATELSEMIFTIPIFPVADTCVPPQNSIDEPNCTTRTSSPYFSPNKAIAPSSLAFSIGRLRYSVKGTFSRILAFTRCSTSRICSGVTFWK